MVDRAEEMLPMLPWPKEFEKDEFLRPDFTRYISYTYVHVYTYLFLAEN